MSNASIVKKDYVLYENIQWLPKGAKMEILFQEEDIPTTAVFAFIFSKDKEFIYLMDNRNRSRGIDIPGGHIDAGETELEALNREVLEEVGLSISNIKYIGMQKITKDIPEDKYPDLVSAQKFYFAEIEEVLTTELEDDSLGLIKMKVKDYNDYLKDRAETYYKPLYMDAFLASYENR